MIFFEPKISSSLLREIGVFHHFSAQVQYWYQLNRKTVVIFHSMDEFKIGIFVLSVGNYNEIEVAFQVQVAPCN